MYCRGAIRAQSLAAPVILSVINVHVILLFQTNKPDDDDDDVHWGDVRLNLKQIASLAGYISTPCLLNFDEL